MDQHFKDKLFEENISCNPGFFNYLVGNNFFNAETEVLFCTQNI